MDERDDPYCPGAGIPPHELAGRENIIDSIEIAIERAKAGKPAKHQILLGLRGVGKTVLLVEFEGLAERLGCHPTSVIEADSNKTLPEMLLPQLLRLMIRLDRIKQAEQTAAKGMRLLRAVASMFSVKMGSVEVSVTEGEATGDLASDLTDVFIETGNIAAARKTSVVILIDEIQCLPQSDFAALIIALHKVSQKRLPLTFIGAGLPQLPKFSRRREVVCGKIV